jgi:hypothetical protein
MPIFDCEFIACTQETFISKLPQILERIGANVQFRNPFIASAAKGKKDDLWQGYLREWNVFEYHTIQSNNNGWGVSGPGGSSRLTICYHNGELGIAVRWNTGRLREVNSLVTFKSMYHA